MKRQGVCAAAVAIGVWAYGQQAALLVNADFEQGAGAVPAGWVLPQGKGGWERGAGLPGGACVAVRGDGTDSSAWQTAEPVAFLPSRAYRLSVRARGEGAAGGTAVCGPAFANVDLGVPGRDWTLYSHVFATPVRKDLLAAPLRLGQWQTRGAVLFDDVTLMPVEAVHRPFGEGALGEGERLDGNRYLFEAPLGGEGRNHSRPLLYHTAGFNTDRWCFGEGGMVTYRHGVAGRRFLSGEVELTCGYYVSGKLTVEASADAKEWMPLGVLTNSGGLTAALPAALVPAEAVYVRLRGLRDGCSLQLHGYTFRGEVDGEPAVAVGATRYVEAESYGRRVQVHLRDLGDAVPGARNTVSLRVQCLVAQPVETAARVLFARPGEVTRTNQVPLSLPGAGAYEVEVPYEVPGVGLWEMTVAVSNAFVARSTVRVPELYSDAYGELIPVNHPQVNLWRASSGWKIPQARALPQRIAKGLSLRVAQNEREAVQLVVTPKVALTNVQVSVSELVCGRAKIAREEVDVLRVGTVPVTRRTDALGVAAEWPDPLLPQTGALTVEAGRNQAYWVRVRAAEGLPAGIYRGTVTVEADGMKVATVLSVEVYGFALPQRMTCETAFGFSPSAVWRYHGVTEPAQRREVLDKYLKLLGESRLSPYDPAPMDAWTVTWKGLNPWRGGTLDTREKAVGAGSLFILDESEKVNVSADYPQAVAVPKKGFRIAFQHKTTKGQRFLLSIRHFRADGTWMSGCNTDLTVEGAEAWRAFERTQTVFPEGAASARFAVFAAGYQEPGVETGGVWLDAFEVTDLDTGREVVEGGAFEPPALDAVTPVFDWSAWDAAMERAFTKYGFNTFMMKVEGLGGGTFHERYEPSFLGYPGGSPEYEVLMGKYLKGIESHLREKGWLDRAYVYWFDEPDPKDYAFVMKGFETLKRHAPGLRRMLTEQVEKELTGGPNLWVPLTPSLAVEGLSERREAGDQFWWYVCCGPKAPYATLFIDHPGTEMRVWLWQTWAERVTGVLVWETVYWTSPSAYPEPGAPQNPYRDPMSWVSGYDSKAGTRQPWGNGDGRFLYPPPAAADGRPAAPVLEGPVASIRLEMLRDGIEDYEYFVILRRLLAEKGARLDPRERANWEALLKVPEQVSAGLTNFTNDPEPLEAHRDRLARAIVELMRR